MPDQTLPKAQVKPMRVVRRMPPNGPDAPPPKQPEKKPDIQWVKHGRKSFADRLTRNVAMAASILLCVVALRSAAFPAAQDVFSAVKESVTLDLDETLGKLTFVSTLLPEAALVFLDSSETLQVFAPVKGDVVHAWREAEPYIGLLGASQDVRAAAEGDVMNVAHGDNEERILRIRHDNGLETMYGNLEESYVSEGDHVYAGDILGVTQNGQPVYFELRKNGRSIDPTSYLREVVTVP